VFAHAPSVLVRRAADFVVVLGAQDEPVVLRDSALAVWDAFAEPASIEDVATSLASVYDAPVTVIRPEVARVVDELAAIDALVAVDGTT
jgi:hypothetical protein